MATDIIRPLSESTGRRIADTLDILTNGGTVTDTSVVIPEVDVTSTYQTYYYDANPGISIPRNGSALTLTYNGQAFTARYAGIGNHTYFAPESATDPSKYYAADIVFNSDYVEVYSQTDASDPYVDDGDNVIRLEMTVENVRKGILELMAGSGGGSWETVVPETEFTKFSSSDSAKVDGANVPGETGGVYAVTVDGARYGASMSLYMGNATFKAEDVRYGDGIVSTLAVSVGSGGAVWINRDDYTSTTSVTIAVEKLS